MASARRTIHNKLIEILKTISAANGYQQDVATVSKKVKDIEMIASFPELSVIGGEQVVRGLSEEDTLCEIDASFTIVGYIKTQNDSGDDGVLSDTGDDLIEDIKDALLNNLSGFISATAAKELRIVSDEPIFDYRNNWGYVTVGIRVTYYRDISA